MRVPRRNGSARAVALNFSDCVCVCLWVRARCASAAESEYCHVLRDLRICFIARAARATFTDEDAEDWVDRRRTDGHQHAINVKSHGKHLHTHYSSSV